MRNCIFYFAGLLFLTSISLRANEEIPVLDLGSYVSVKNSIDTLISADAKKYYNENYLHANKNKAFAQSISGAWASASDHTSEYHAKNIAMIICERRNLKRQIEAPCEIVNVNGIWFGTSLVPEK
jgi:hypothetical protein